MTDTPERAERERIARLLNNAGEAFRVDRGDVFPSRELEQRTGSDRAWLGALADAVLAEIARVTAERDDQRVRNDTVETVNDALRAHRDRLRAERDALTAELADLRAKLAQAEAILEVDECACDDPSFPGDQQCDACRALRVLRAAAIRALPAGRAE